jgi:hypothetical protein
MLAQACLFNTGLAAVVWRVATCLLKDVVDERVHDGHGLGRDTCAAKGIVVQ